MGIAGNGLTGKVNHYAGCGLLKLSGVFISDFFTPTILGLINEKTSRKLNRDSHRWFERTPSGSLRVTDYSEDAFLREAATRNHRRKRSY